ncbi:MAG: sigma-70 family RNA polymerase sigma factor [Bacteroidota bacterium]
MSHINDDIIIDRILDGDESQYKILIDKYKVYAFTLAMNVLGNREDAEEVAQDSFIKAFKNLKKFNREAKFSTWFYRIVTNTAITRTRKSRIVGEDIDAAYAVGVAAKSELEIEDQKTFIRKGIALLSDQDKLMISLFYLKELSLDEIAQVTELKTNLIKVKLHRARKRLADHLKTILKEEALNL